MKNILKITLCICLLFTAFNCSNDNEVYNTNPEIENRAELNSKIVSSNFSEKLTPIFSELGVASIKKSEGDDYSIFKTIKNSKITAPRVLINGLNIDLSNLEFILKNEFISLRKNKDIKMTIIDNEPYIITKEFSGYLKSNPELLLDIDNLTLLLFLNEITTPYRHETEAKLPDFQGSCSFWNTWYSVGVGLSESSSLANFNYSHQDDINSGSTINCVKLGGVEHSTVGVVHYHTQAYCCR